MASRQPRRTRRRKAPADSLPRIHPDRERARHDSESHAGEGRRSAVREHDVTTDYRYVKNEMAIVAAVSAVTFGFIVVMAFIVPG
jgi:hypothetical protein